MLRRETDRNVAHYMFRPERMLRDVWLLRALGWFLLLLRLLLLEWLLDAHPLELLYAVVDFGVDILRRALQAPARQIAENAGHDGSVVHGTNNTSASSHEACSRMNMP